MMSSVVTSVIDSIDRQIIHVLTLHPRASFRTIADVTKISDQTAARRYRRMRETAGLRVLGVVNGHRVGWVDWMIRLQTTPGSASAIADALARRADTRWVRLFSGGTEVVCVLQARTAEQRNALFLRGLPGSRRVVQMSAHASLHEFSPLAWVGMASALSGAQLARLAELTEPPPAQPMPTEPMPTEPRPTEPMPTEPRPTEPMPTEPRRPTESTRPTEPTEPVTLEPDDDLLLGELAKDGRATNAALAAATHWHESTVRRRIAELCRAGVLYFDVDLADAVLGHDVSAMLWLSVEPARLDQVGRAMAEHPQIPFVAAMTGPSNLVASGVFRDTQNLYEYLTGPMAALPGIRSAEATPIIGTLKRTGTVTGAQAPP